MHISVTRREKHNREEDILKEVLKETSSAELNVNTSHDVTGLHHMTHASRTQTGLRST